MPRYRIRDNETGATLLVEGPTPPSPEVAAELFAKRKAAPAPPPEPAQPEPTESFEPVGQFAGLVNSARRGLISAQAIPEVLQLVGSRDFDKTTIGDRRKAYVQAMSDPRYNLAGQQRLNPLTGLYEDDAPAARRMETTVGQAGKLDRNLAGRRAFKEATIQNVAESQAALAALPKSEAQQELSQAELQSQKWAAWAKNPVELTAAIALESLPPSIAGAAAGSLAGPGGMAIGAGTASGLATFSGELLGNGSQKYNLSTPEGVRAWVDSDEFETDVGQAAVKAQIVGTVDAATAGTAGKFLAPALRQGYKRVLIGSAKEAGLQMAGGAGGEALGQVASGQPLDTFDIAMEAVAELASAPGEVAGNLWGDRKQPPAIETRPLTRVRPTTDQRQPMPVETARGTDIDPNEPMLEPTAVFKGANGQNIRLALGTATLDQVKEYVFRTQPGATFAGVEGTSVAPINPTENVPAAAEPPAPSPAQSTVKPISSEVTPPSAATTGGTPTVQPMPVGPAARPAEAGVTPGTPGSDQTAVGDSLEDRRVAAVENITTHAAQLGFEVDSVNRSGFGSWYVEITDPDSGRTYKMRLADHERQLSSIINHKSPDFESVFDKEGDIDAESVKSWLDRLRERIRNLAPIDYAARTVREAKGKLQSYNVQIEALERNKLRSLNSGNEDKAKNIQQNIDDILKGDGYKQAWKDANAGVAPGVAETKTSDTRLEQADKGSVADLQPGRASALTDTTQPQPAAAVKPALEQFSGKAETSNMPVAPPTHEEAVQRARDNIPTIKQRAREWLEKSKAAEAVRAAAAQLNTPEAVADVLLNPDATDAQQAAAEAKADEVEGGIRIRLGQNPEGAFILNPADLLIAGARMLRRLGLATATKAQWTAAMLKAYGQRVANHLTNLWTRLARLQNQQANNVGPVAQGHINAVEELAGRTNIAEEEKPLYDAATLAKGNPGIVTKAAPVSTQIKILGGQDLLNAKRRRDVEEATAAAAVKKQSDELWQQLVQSAARGNPLTQWKLPNWLVGTPRARKFKERALHIAARLNATGRDVNGNFVFTPFRQRMGSMTPKEFRRGQHQVGAQIQMQSPVTGQIETVTIGPFVSTADGRAFYQLYRDIDSTTQADLYAHYANEYPDMIWFLDMFIDPALANTRQTINGIEVPVFNRFAAAAMMADGNPNFSPLAAYTPDVLVTRSLLGSIRGALSFRAGTRSPGRKYKSGTSREGGHVRDLLSGFNIRTWQMLAEQSRRQWMQAVMQAATPIRQNQVPAGWVKVETGMEELWQAVKRLRNWSSPESRRDITKQVQDDGLEEIEETLKPTERIVQKGGRWYVAEKLFPETEARLSERGQLDEDRDYQAFFGEAARLRGKQLMLPEALVKQLVQKYRAQVEHGRLYRLGAWAVRNSTRLFLVAPTTYVANVLTNDLFTLEAATRRILSGAAGRNAQDLRFARELMVGEFWKWFPGLRGLVDRQYRDTVEQVLPDNLFADQTALADLKMRLDEDPISYLRQGEIGAAALQVIRYGNIDVRSKQRMAYAWLKAMALTNAKQAGLRGAALRTAVDRYLVNPPVADRAKAVEIAGFELLNYADTPDWLQNFANNDYIKLVLPFPRFGYHYLAKNAHRAAAVRDLLARVPEQRRADAFADLVTFLLWPAGGLGVLAAYGIRGLGDDDDEARKLVGTSRIKTLDEAGDVVSKPIDRALITSNRINLSAWARQLGLGTEMENDFWLRVRNYPVVAMAGAALLAEEDARKFGPAEGAKTYLSSVFDLGSDFFSVGMAGKVPAKAFQELTSRPKDRTMLDPYSANVPLLAYITDQTLDSFVPGTRQADILIRWLDPVQRRRTASKTLDFEPTVWDAARVGHVTGLMDRLLAGQPGEFGPMQSTLPPEGRVVGGMVQPQVYPPLQRVAELGGFNVRPVNRAAYEGALTP